MLTANPKHRQQRARTGVPGLDDILHGGLPRDRLYLVRGRAGSGKTTLALQFLLEGRDAGENVLLITVSESKQELEAIAQSHGLSLDGVEIYEMVADRADDAAEENTLYIPAEVELTEQMRSLIEVAHRTAPTRIVFDSITELRLLAQTPLRFRRKLLQLKEELVEKGSTVLLIDVVAPGAEDGDGLLASVAHGIIELQQLPANYGETRRQLYVEKLRESAFCGGYHDFVIRRGGITAFPRLSNDGAVSGPVSRGVLKSGVVELDALLGGGFHGGTSTLIMGPSGTGKSTLADRYAVEAAIRGERSELLLFDEGVSSRLARCDSLNLPVREHVENGLISMQRVDPATLSPGELLHRLRRAVEVDGAKLVIVDSINGYLSVMAREDLLILQMHQLLSYLERRGVATMLVMAEHGLVGSPVPPLDISYISDNVVLLRYFEAAGRVRRAISVVKRRYGAHEDAIREFRLDTDGIRIGQPLEKFRGVLSGTPEYFGGAEKLLAGEDEA